MNAASILWPENELDTAIQHLFDKYLNKTPTNDNGILLSDECRDFIPHFFVIWENCECKMTARNDFHIPGRALSGVHSESGIHRPRFGPRFLKYGQVRSQVLNIFSVMVLDPYFCWYWSGLRTKSVDPCSEWNK